MNKAGKSGGGGVELVRTKRKTKKRRGKKQGPKPGKVVRLSPEVISFLDEKRGRSSYDAFLRLFLGIEEREKGKRDGSLRKPKSFWLLKSTGQLFPSKAEARGAAVVEAVKKKTKTAERPVLLRESV